MENLDIVLKYAGILDEASYSIDLIIFSCVPEKGWVGGLQITDLIGIN